MTDEEGISYVLGGESVVMGPGSVVVGERALDKVTKVVLK